MHSKNRLLLSFLFVVFFLAGHICLAQKLTYNVIKGNKTIGTMTCERQRSEREVLFAIESETKIKIIFTLNIVYSASERFVDGILAEGRAVSTLNGDIQKESVVKKENGTTRVVLDDIPEEFDSDKIRYSIPHLYFHEPKDQSHVFSQQFADFLELEKIDDKAYLMISEDGKNTYRYNERGICSEVKVSRAYATFYFRLVD